MFPPIEAKPQPGGPCGLHTLTDPNFVQIKLEAKANGPFRVTLSWSGPAGLYHLNEVGGPFQKDVNFKPKRFGNAASVVQEPALPGSKHNYVVKAQLPDGRTACGTASVTTPSPPQITSVNAQYVHVHNVTINYHLPPYITALRILRQPREVVERPNPANPDILIIENKKATGPDGADSSWSGDPGPPPFPCTHGQYDKSAASYPFILEAVWTKWPDGSGERVSVRTSVSVSGPTPIVGYSDLHAHMFSYLGFGGHFWGKAFGRIAEALAWCTSQHGPGGTGDLANYIMQIATVGHVPPNTGPGTGWFRIVKSPKEARDVIAAGKLAVLIGMEVDYPFECTVNNTSCTESFMRSEVSRYYDLGVRHFFPIHFYDNAFGGSANSNALVTRQLKNTGARRDCSASGFQYDNAQCNDKGLTLLGRQLIRELMKQGMIIDIDHMSEKGIQRHDDFGERYKISCRFEPYRFYRDRAQRRKQRG